MPSTAVKLVIDDPENFHLLTTDMKEMLAKGATATVNVQAALTRKNAIEILKSDFTLRNNFTVSQIQFTQSPEGARNLSEIESRIGATEKAGYMALQEFGGKRQPKSGKQIAFPANEARGGNKGSPVLKKHYLNTIKRKTIFTNFRRNHGKTHSTPGSALVAAAALAAKNEKYLRYGNGLFEVKNFTKLNRENVHFNLKNIYSFGNQYDFNPNYIWLRPAKAKPEKDAENIFIAQMKKLGM